MENTPNPKPRPPQGSPELKLLQLSEAQNLLDDLSWRVSWALDFSEFASISEALNPVLQAIDTALDNIDEEKDALESAIEYYQEKKGVALREFEEENSLKPLLR
jgi:hypothetical protein